MTSPADPGVAGPIAPGPTARDEVRDLLVAVGRLVTRETSLEALLSGVTEQVAKALDVDGCLLYRIEANGDLVLATGYPTPAEPAAKLRLPAGFGVTGRVAADSVPAVLVDDMPRNPLHRQLLGLHEGETVSRLCVPARLPPGSPGSCVAVLAAHSRARRVFSSSELAAVQQVADLIGLRVQRDRTSTTLAQFQEQWEDLVEATVSAQETERRRIAGDLHDGVTQVVAGLSFHLSAAELALTDADYAYAAEQVHAARGLADLAFAELRSAISGLHSPVIDDLGLTAGLVSMVRAVPGLHVEVDAADVDLPQHVASALFRVAQEAVQNVAKHADARTAVVRLVQRGRTVVLSITDDGCGFDVSTQLSTMPRMPTAAQYGLAGMFERVQLLGGQLTVDSEPGRGTTVEAVVPGVAD